MRIKTFMAGIAKRDQVSFVSQAAIRPLSDMVNVKFQV